MKIILNEEDQSYIDKVNQDLSNNEDCPLFINEQNKTYTLEFECVDIAKANNFILYMLSSNIKNVKEIEDVLGINVKAINYDKGSQQIITLKEILKNALDQLNYIGE